MKMAEEALYSEMAFALGKSKEEMEHFIIDYIENRQEMVCGQTDMTAKEKRSSHSR